ncbi:MAG: GGDEF domain-containing protein, partial [Syntrophales bacterium]
NARLYNQIEQIALTDELTGLFNRRGFFPQGEREFERAARFNRPLAAVMFDIDHFKRVNDTHGHPVGDRVLQALAACFRQNTRGIDVVGRYGGEEFILLLPETLIPEAIQIAERLRSSIEELAVPVRPANGDSPTVDVRVTTSAGIAVVQPDVRTLNALIDLTDRALYRAKTFGRNRIIVWEGVEAEASHG